jgi:hypothetical protein
MLRRYNSLSAAERPGDEVTRMQLFVRLMSEACDADLTDYFAAWGFPTTATRDDDGVLAAFPKLRLDEGELERDLQA